MKERPILFSGEMVRATLEGRKTQTRRVIKPEWYRCLDFDEPEDISKDLAQCPYGQPGDRLWVRETWGAVSPDEEVRPIEECKIEYRADLPDGCTDYPGEWPAEDAKGCDYAPKWRPSIFMPRWASRITLEITGIRVEQIRSISLEDAEAEGVTVFDKSRRNGNVIEFAELWHSINAKRGYGWDVNPWVWVIEFKKVSIP